MAKEGLLESMFGDIRPTERSGPMVGAQIGCRVAV